MINHVYLSMLYAEAEVPVDSAVPGLNLNYRRLPNLGIKVARPSSRPRPGWVSVKEKKAGSAVGPVAKPEWG